MNTLDAERKRKRLEAWRKRQENTQQQQQTTPLKVSLSLNTTATKKLKQKAKHVVVETEISSQLVTPLNPFGVIDDDSDGEDEGSNEKRKSKRIGFMTFVKDEETVDVKKDNDTDKRGNSNNDHGVEPLRKRRRKGRWDSAASTNPTSLPSELIHKNVEEKEEEKAVVDALDKFMEKLDAGAMGSVTTQVKVSESDKDRDNIEMLSIDVGGSMMRIPKLINKNTQPTPLSGGVITSEEIAKLSRSAENKTLSKAKIANPEAFYTPSDWESGAGTADEAETDDDDDDDKFATDNNGKKQLQDEENARRAFIEALKSATGSEDEGDVNDDGPNKKKSLLAAEVKSEKFQREQKFKDLEREAETARIKAEKLATPQFGRLYNDLEGGIMEEAERNLEAAMAAPDALEVLAELNKKKELKSVDHSKVEYIEFKKNLYIVPRALANLTSDEIAKTKAELKIRVRGRNAPTPVSSFEQCGLSERIMKVMEKHDIRKPFPVQAQCIPCIMAGRDVIGIAPTGSGKTLSYLLPMLRHIVDQPPLDSSESGPIGLVLAPARELAYQIHLVCKTFSKPLGLKRLAIVFVH